jgi:hypothetical protein
MFYMTSIMMAKTLRHRQDYLLSQYGITCTFTRNKSARMVELSREIIVAEGEVVKEEPLGLVG